MNPRLSNMLHGTLALAAGHACYATAAEAAQPAQSRPNILWVTAEDISTNLGCYGDPDAVTPILDAFARQSIRFANAYSIHPCCSPSRAALVTGMYPTRTGSFQHRGKVWSDPVEMRTFPSLLREAGYYCFNGMRGARSKLDYNFDPRDNPWDLIESREHRDIHWRNRKRDQPFFGQVNLHWSHQSMYGRPNRKSDDPTPDSAKVHRAESIHVPPYHPDMPQVRDIWREYHDRLTQVDAQFGVVLAQLKADKLDDDTIVFFFGDNGHGVPGGKIWVWDQGIHVPLLVYIPPKWAHFAGGSTARVEKRLVSFVDFAATVLALAGLSAPPGTDGKPFLGKDPASARDYIFAARDFHTASDFDGSRVARDNRYYYIKNLMPHIGWEPMPYAWQQAPGMLESWRIAAKRGKLKPGTRQAAFFAKSKPAEELYDMETDPWQMNNLAGDPAHAETLARLRERCNEWIISTGDLGLLSQYEFYRRSETAGTPFKLAANMSRGLAAQLLAVADKAAKRDPAFAKDFIASLDNPDSAIRRWAAIGLLALKNLDAATLEKLEASLADTSPNVRMTAAEALVMQGRPDKALPVLGGLLSHESVIIRNETLLAIARLGKPAAPLLPDLDKAAKGKPSDGEVWGRDNINTTLRAARALIDPSSKDNIRVRYEKYLP